MTGQGRVVREPENMYTQRARRHNLDKVRVARMDAGKHSIKIVKEQLARSELRCKNRLGEVTTRLFLDDFGAC